MSEPPRSLFDASPTAAPTPVAAPAPPVALASRRAFTVLVEAADDGRYWVHRYRGDAASAAVLYTRDELVELRARIDAALRVTG